ncbi:MAG: LysM peptidoglycan-binding domain-containing protein [Ruminococcus sp.]|uniref:LysM peptidoglycan-binding domain-containing protein n=1 Tax=Ruminococcus sp. TaxID=41978 RepID=UPI002872ADCC|nr:LysM domain-containing protein [Ruminococcus sp.]MBQ3285347.1 LysM peptidoglycan-binding domain-containing protein [Ruminococcus sp.]
MRFAPMRFDGMSLRHNPEKLHISGSDHVKEYRSPCCEADSVSLGRELKRIAGEGEFCGADCIEQYRALEKMQIKAKRAKLALPHMQPMYAYLKELELTAKPMDNVLSYRFVFVEAQSPRPEAQGTEYYLTVSEGENLWDISYEYGVPIERLVALNPHIPLIGELSGGERVRLC